MEKTLKTIFTLRGVTNTVEVNYKTNNSAKESGFDALNVPFDPDLCIGYPVFHAYFKDMVNTGYRRYCGWVQLVKREYDSSELLEKPDESNLSIDTNDPVCIYNGVGYPSELYDAPCNNLNDNVKGKWTAYTYLVDIPSRMNNHEMCFLAGFQWGYEEALINEKLVVNIQDIIQLNIKSWNEHVQLLKEQYPQYKYSVG